MTHFSHCEGSERGEEGRRERGDSPIRYCFLFEIRIHALLRSLCMEDICNNLLNSGLDEKLQRLRLELIFCESELN